MPNAGGVVAGGDASVNANSDRFLCSTSDGVERTKALAIIPVRPIGRACDERRAAQHGREDERFWQHRFHSECVMGPDDENYATPRR